MGVLIKGLTKPNSCEECLFHAAGVCIINRALEPDDELTHSCPLIEVPTPHGRLIDADRLMWNMGLNEAVKYGNKTAEQQEFSYGTLMRYEIADVIEDAPTIIPAEEGEA